MKLIPLTQGQYAKVDDEDFERFGKFKWFANWSSSLDSFYAVRNVRGSNGKQTLLLLHREILGVTNPRIKVDHRNHDTLDCQRYNLRPATNSQNMANRKGLGKNNTSGYRGVCWRKDCNRWQARIGVEGRMINLGFFDNIINASEAYSRANRSYFGEFGGALK